MAFVRWNQSTQIWEVATAPDSPTSPFNHLPVANPTAALDIANKQYVDSKVAGIGLPPFVPYNGATAQVNLNTQNFLAGTGLFANGLGPSVNLLNHVYGHLVVNAGDASLPHLALHYGGVVVWQIGYSTGVSNLKFGAGSGPVIQFDNTGAIYERTRTVPIGDWINVPFGSLTFSASGSMTWSVPSVSYFKYAIVGKTIFIRGAITGTTTGGTASSGLRVSIAGISFATSDAFGMSVYSDNGFASQGLGQSIARAAGYLEFKHPDGSNWPIASGIAVLFNIVAELA